MDIQKRELWNRLENEPERAYRAFEVFLRLPSNERTLTAAYQRHVDNPDARPSDTWSGWSKDFAWRRGLQPTTTTLRASGEQPTRVRWRKRQRGKLARSKRPEAV
jgi:hypothetical protein